MRIEISARTLAPVATAFAADTPTMVHLPSRRVDVRSAVAAGFEPARGLPPYTLSRRAPSSARAGHREQSTGGVWAGQRPNLPRGLRSKDAVIRRGTVRGDREVGTSQT